VDLLADDRSSHHEDTAALYRLSPAHADAVISEVREAVSNWAQVAEAVGLSREERDLMGDALAGAERA